MVLSCEFRSPRANLAPVNPCSISIKPKHLFPSSETANSILCTPMWRKPKVSTRASTTSWWGIGRCVAVPGGVGMSANCSGVMSCVSTCAMSVDSIRNSSCVIDNWDCSTGRRSDFGKAVGSLKVRRRPVKGLCRRGSASGEDSKKRGANPHDIIHDCRTPSLHARFGKCAHLLLNFDRRRAFRHTDGLAFRIKTGSAYFNHHSVLAGFRICVCQKAVKLTDGHLTITVAKVCPATTIPDGFHYTLAWHRILAVQVSPRPLALDLASLRHAKARSRMPWQHRSSALGNSVWLCLVGP